MIELCLERTICLNWVLGHFSPASDFSKIDAGTWAKDRSMALTAYEELLTPVWVFGCPGGRKSHSQSWDQRIGFSVISEASAWVVR